MNVVNTAHNDRWRFSFSNYPNVDKSVDMDIFDNFVKSCTIPDLSIDEQYVDFRESRFRYSGSRYNENNSPLIIEFNVTENMENYLYVFEHMLELKSGRNNVYSKERENVIKTIDVFMLDNHRREKARILFTNCFPINLNALDLRYGSSEEMIFSVTYTYDEMKFERL